MLRFALPKVPESKFRTFVSLTVEADFSLERHEIQTIRNQLVFTDDAYHASFRRPVKLGDKHAELAGIIGVHDFEISGKAGTSRPRRRYLHYEIELRTTPRPRSTKTTEWVKAITALLPLIPNHAAAVGLRLRATPSTVLAVKLPIPIGAAETPGFVEIRGVRLVQPDREEPSKELYSVILDSYARHVSIYVSAIADVTFGQTMLAAAFDRAIGIADLAAWTGD